MIRNAAILTILCAALALPHSPVNAASELRGLLTADGVKSATGPAHGWGEELVYIGGVGSVTGAGVRTIKDPMGWYSLKFPGGRQIPGGDYTFYSFAYDSMVAFDYKAGVKIPDGTALVDHQNFATSAHYAVMYDKHWTDWSQNPWVKGTDFYQTFVATTEHVTRIAIKISDKTPSYTQIDVDYAIYETNDGPPSTWKLISPVRTRIFTPHTDPIIHIYHVNYHSNEVNLKPGKTYAVRLSRGKGSTSEEFALVVRPDKGDGYKQGQLYLGDEARPDLDGYIYVSGGAANTVCNIGPVDMEKVPMTDLLGWNERFGQTFTASGKGLAGADIVYARQWGQPLDIPVTFQIYDGVGGKPIGPAKTCYGAPGSFQARAAAFWSPGEVKLKPGKTYYIEGRSEGLNIWPCNENFAGDAYLDGKLMEGKDLMMSVVEYEK